MNKSNLETMIGELVPDLNRHLNRTLSMDLKARYPVDDIVHDTYVRAVERIGTIRQTNHSSLVAWLQRIAHRLVIDKIRQKQSQQIKGREASAIYSALTSSRQLTPSREYAATEAVHAMEIALANLTDDHRLVLKFRYFEQLTFVEIAQRIDRTTGAVRGLHRTALQHLRHEMGGSALYFVR